jgi:hypothetical protein
MSALVRSPRNTVCHLVEDGERRTACGLMRVNRAHLRVFAVKEIPPRHTLCKHCERTGGDAVDSHARAASVRHIEQGNA